MMLELSSNDIPYVLSWTDLVISQSKVTCHHSVEHVALQQRCEGERYPVRTPAPSAQMLFMNGSTIDHDSRYRFNVSRPQTVWLQAFSWPPSDRHTAITGTYVELAFIKKRNRSPLHPPMNSGLVEEAPLSLKCVPNQRSTSVLGLITNARSFLRGSKSLSENDVNDEAHFWLNGYVNKQKCRIWSEANTQVYVETPLHPEKLTAWCALWAGGIIGPYFFKNDEGHNVTVNGDRYRAMITNFFIPELNNHDVQELWFQQDGAACHAARATIDLLKDTFGDRLISGFGPVNWPPRSCDLTPLDYFLWGYVKSLVYADKPQTLDHLEDNIRRVIADIRPQMLEKVIENWTSRLDYIRASRGSHMPEII
ncbi:transposable element Tc3 transposase [Trichonephila clavipes]|nr:transposable element Tc3 transposase [Trichonephila clavipes]